MRRIRLVVARGAVLVAVASCAGTDSAGDAHTDASTSADAIPLDDFVPLTAHLDLRVGSVEGDEYAFTAFRALEVGPEGEMLTLHSREHLVRVFDRAGRLLRSFGSEGQGPAEFQRPMTMGQVGDTLWVFDLPTYKFLQFSRGGEFLGSFAVPFTMRENLDDVTRPRAAGLLTDGTVHGAPPAWAQDVADGSTTHRFPVLLTRDGEVTDSLPPVPIGRDMWAVVDPNEPRRASYAKQPFADGPLWSYVPGERTVVWVDRETPETREDAHFRLTKLSFSGDTVFSRKVGFDPIPVTEVELDSLLTERALSLAEGTTFDLTEGRAREWADRTLYRPAYRSPAQELVVGRDGSIWVRMTSRTDSSSWLVFDRSGEPGGRITLPTSFELMEADLSHVWGSERDELDVAYLLRFRIERAAAG